MESKEEIVDVYDENHKRYENFKNALTSLINILLDSENIIPHTVSARVKDRDSLLKKIDKKDKYSTIDEITDVIGVRIITHYSDEVDAVAALLKKEFNVDEENSIDKRELLDPDRFGYLSLHYVAELSKERIKLLEYKQFDKLKFEIQVRSILQHTWAEIEHDIGYKSKSEVPKEVRRQFSRLAGLLEIADSEFVNIRNSLDDYEKYVGDTILTSPEDINIDAISLYKFISTSKEVKNLDSKIVKVLNCKLINSNQEIAAKLVKNIEYFGISTIFELSDILRTNQEKIIKALKLLLSKKSPNTDEIKGGISLRFLSYVLAAETLDEDGYNNFAKAINLSKSFPEYLKDLKELL